jgi:hypothetical protein
MLLKDKWNYRTVDLLHRKGFDMGDKTIRGRYTTGVDNHKD